MWGMKSRQRTEFHVFNRFLASGLLPLLAAGSVFRDEISVLYKFYFCVTVLK